MSILTFDLEHEKNVLNDAIDKFGLDSVQAYQQSVKVDELLCNYYNNKK